MILAHGDGSAGLPWAEYALTVVLTAVALVGYRWASAPPGSTPRSRRSRHRLWCWWGAMASIVATQLPPMGQWVDESFAAHMVQHVVLVSISAPLIVLVRPGAALGGAARAAGWSGPVIERTRSAGRTLGSPVLCWAAVVGYIWFIHFSPIYDLAVENDAVHLLEHVGFLVAGVLAWLPVLGPRHLTLPDPLKVLYVMVLMPALTFCGVTLFSADHVMYSSYAGRPDALADQRLGGMIMWILPGAALMPLALVLVVRWWRREEQAAAWADLADVSDPSFEQPGSVARSAPPVAALDGGPGVPPEGSIDRVGRVGEHETG